MYAPEVFSNSNYTESSRINKMQYKPFIVHDATTSFGQYKDPLADSLGKLLTPNKSFNNAVNLASMGRTNFTL